MKSFENWKFWERHANYLSGWTRVGVYPFLIASLYIRDWITLAVVIVFTIINPVLFPKPKNNQYWMTKGVLGEQLWIKKKKKHKKANMLNLFNGIAFLVMLVGIYYQLLYVTVLMGTTSGILKLLFLEEMVLLYEKEKKA